MRTYVHTCRPQIPDPDPATELEPPADRVAEACDVMLGVEGREKEELSVMSPLSSAPKAREEGKPGGDSERCDVDQLDVRVL